MLKFFLLLALIPALALAAGTPVRTCSNGRPPARQVRVAGCTSPPCVVVQGSSARAAVDFRAANGPHNTLRPVVNAILGSSSVPYPLPGRFLQACNSLAGNSRCPIARNEDATFNFEMPISRSYPPIRLGVELSLVDHNNRVVFCNIIDVQVRRA